MKKLFSIALALCLLLSVALADVTLTKVYKTEDLVSNTFHNGFVTAIGMTGENTVVLKDDGTYEYTKRLMQTAEDGTVTADIVYTVTGHRNGVSLGFQCLYQFQFLLRCYSSEDAICFCSFRKLFRGSQGNSIHIIVPVL